MMDEVWSGTARKFTALGGLLIGVAALVVARDSPEYSFSAGSPASLVVGFAAGASLVAAGILSSDAPQTGRFGVALAAAGIAWFLLEFDNPGAGAAAVFAVGLVLHAACPPLLAHALFAYPARTPRRPEVVILAAGYVIALVPLGILPAIAFDPETQGCALCPGNPLAVRAMPDVLTWSLNAGSVSLIGWVLAVSVLLGRRLTSATVAARLRLSPVLLPGLVYVGLAGAWFWNGLGPGFPGTDPTGRLLWHLQALALLAVAAGTAVVRVRRWRTRTAVGRLVVEATQAGSGELREALAHLLKDPSLAILFPLA
ncbi:MAG TPA: hypothetical protein VNP92_19670, partial [Actinophytocola sp.]|nr:hypothetical protein [Actinophytocola sp.]